MGSTQVSGPNWRTANNNLVARKVLGEGTDKSNVVFRAHIPKRVTKIILKVTLCKINHLVILLPCHTQNNCQVYLGCIFGDHVKSLCPTCSLYPQEKGVCCGKGTKHRPLFLKMLQSKRKVSCAEIEIPGELPSTFKHQMCIQILVVKNS